MDHKFNPGAKVFAKVRGYPFWPARVEGSADETPSRLKYHVYFYGTGETAVVKAEDICTYVENKSKWGKAKRYKNFKEAVMQIEADLSPEESKLLAELEENEANNSKRMSVPGDGKKSLEEEDSPPPVDEPTPKPPSRRASTSKTPQSVPPKPKAKIEKKRKSEAEEEDPENKKVKTLPTVDAPKSDVSRSGRKLKQKKFADSVEEAEVKSVEGDDRCVTAIVNGADIQIPLHLNRPSSAQTDLAKWDETVLKYATTLKERLESGETLSEPVHEHMERWTKDKAKEMTQHQTQDKTDTPPNPDVEKLRHECFQTESKFLHIDIEIKSALSLKQAHPEHCVELLDNLKNLQLTPLMLKKHPDVVHTVKKLRRYVGNTMCWVMTEQEMADFNNIAAKIRAKADAVYNHFKSIFRLQANQPFWDFFSKELDRFTKKTKDMSPEAVYALIHEPE